MTRFVALRFMDQLSLQLLILNTYEELLMRNRTVI